MAPILFPAAALLCGTVGGILRVWELSTAFEPDTGLPIPGTPASLALVLFSALAVLLLGLLALRMCRKAPPMNFDTAFACENPGYITAVVSAAALPVCAAGLIVWAVLARERSFFHLLSAGLLLLSAGSLVYTGRNNYRRLGQGQFSTALLLPPFALCCQLMLTYQSCSGNPVVQEYADLLLSLIAAILAFYFMAGFAFGSGRPLCFLWTSGLAVYFSCLCLVSTLLAGLRGRADWPNLALSAFSIVYFTVHTGVLLRNLTGKEETPHE